MATTIAMADYSRKLAVPGLRDAYCTPFRDRAMQCMVQGAQAKEGPMHLRLSGPSYESLFQSSALQLPREGQHKYVLKKLRSHGIHASAVTVPSTDSITGIDWDNVGFSMYPTDYMYIMKCERGGEWKQGELKPYGNLELSPSAGVLNYGQGLFEGLKAYRTHDDRIFLFRPNENALRMLEGATRMSMDAPPEEEFVSAMRKTVLANQRWIPPSGKGALYLRPLLIGSGSVLGLAPAPEYSFVVYASPVGNYFKGGLAPVDLKVETYYHRAAPGGTGGVKTIGNYAPVLKTQMEAKSKGYSDVIYLDAVNNRYVEEVSSCNIFIVRDGEIITPNLGSILPGVTRKSIIELARDRGYKVSERPVSVDELMDADEVFCTGTAVVVIPVGSITYSERRVHWEEYMQVLKCGESPCFQVPWEENGTRFVDQDHYLANLVV